MGAIITGAYTSAATYPLNHARIGYQSWASALTAAAVTVSTEAAGFPKDAPLRPDTYELWKPTAAPATWVVDLGQNRSFNYVGIAGGLTGILVTVETATAAAPAVWTTFAAAVTPADGAPLLFLDAARNARYVRVTIGTIGVLASVYVGTILEMERPFFDGFTPPNLARQTETRSSVTRGGQFVGQDILSYGFATAVSWNNLTPSWYRSNFDAVAKHLRTRPIFFAWNLNVPAEVAYVWTGDKVAPVNAAQTPGGRMNVGFSIQGIGYRD
jgi:hypothetical protein